MDIAKRVWEETMRVPNTKEGEREIIDMEKGSGNLSKRRIVQNR